MALPENLQAALLDRGQEILNTPWESLPASVFLEFSRTGDRTDYEQHYFLRRRRLCDVVLAECIENKGRFLDEIANGVWLICDEAFWGVPAHLTLQKDGIGLPDVNEPIVDLFAAETSSMLAWTLYLLGKQLDHVSQRINERVRVEQKRRILDPVLERSDFWWMGLEPEKSKINNWNPWINSNCIATTLLLETDAERRVSLLSKMCKSLDAFLADYSPDGGCEEGPVYWQRSAASFFDCCWLLTSATQRAAEPLLHPFVKRMGHYIVDVHIAGRFYVNYGDAHAEDSPTPELLYRFGTATRDEALSQFGVYASRQHGMAGDDATVRSAIMEGLPSLARSLQDVLSVPEISKLKGADALQRDSWYPALKLMTARRVVDSTQGFYLAVQASGNGRSHGHNDTGSFIVFVDGQPLFIDVGVEAYTAKTFSKERYSIWTMQSAYHNLPTIGGIMQHEGSSYHASAVQYRNTDSAARISMDLAGAYPASAGIQKWVRELILDRANDTIALSEKFELHRSQPIMLTFMTPRKPGTEIHGVVRLPGTQSESRTPVLKYDAAQLEAKVETIELKDDGLRRTWGNTIYRLLLTSRAAAEKGTLRFTIEREPAQ